MTLTSLFRLALSSMAALALAACSTSAPSPQQPQRGQAPPPGPGQPPAQRFAVNPPGTPPMRCSSYILLDAISGQPLAEYGADQQRAVASTQKIVMALVVLDAGNLDRRVTFTAADKSVRSDGVKIAALRVGDTATRRELLYTAMVKSANDVVQALARDVGGSQERFVQMMNAKARFIGMHSSFFANPHGMPANQHSTARDMARAAWVAIRNPLIRDAARRQSWTFTTGAGRRVSVEATNKLLARMPECTGLKTGYTAAAGPCLISSAARNGRAVILVQLDSQKGDARWDDARMMLDWGLRRVGG